MSGDVAKVYETLARVAGSISNELRLRLLDILAQGEKSVDELTENTGAPLANVSHHLQMLYKAGLVQRRRDGMRVRYRLSSDRVVRMIDALRGVTFTVHRDIDRFVRHLPYDPDGHVVITRDEAMSLLKRKAADFLDVRPANEFVAGHIAGARNIPYPELEKRLAEIKPDRQLVVYCRGPLCLDSSRALSLLDGKGFRVRRLEDGFPEWKSYNFPVEYAG